MQTKIVGVVIPIYNVEEYLRECLDSVVNQTYKNLQVILVNDGSTDKNSLNIAKECTLKDERFILFDKENGGQSTARNVGIEFFSKEYDFKNITQELKENSLVEFKLNNKNNPYNIYKIYKSSNFFKNKDELLNFKAPDIDYIIFLDSDDYWELNCIEECVPRMDGVEVVWFDHYFNAKDNSTNRYTIIELFNLKKSTTFNSFQIVYLLNKVKYNMFHFAWSGLINFTFLSSNHIMFLNNIIWEDQLFGIKLLTNANLFYILKTKQYHYRIRSNSICSSNELYPYVNYLSTFFSSRTYARKYYERYSWVIISKHIIEDIENLNKKKLKKIMKKNFFDYYIDRSQQFLFCDKDPYNYRDLILIKTNDYTLLFKNTDKNILYNFIVELYRKLNEQYDNVKNLTDITSLREKVIEKKQKQIENLHQNIKNIKKILSQNESLLSFQNKHNTVKFRIQNQLSYKIGQTLIINSKSVLGYLSLPFIILSIVISHKQEQKAYKFKVKKNPNLALPPLETYPDYNEALKEKECFTYKLGEAFIKASKNWYGGGYIKFYFKDVPRLKREYKRKR
ncbi:glycosyltransferase family 2 protein [Campylobacter jejuni subsp. jejuni]|uniref:glycosyltransferase family 2 protein n=1 Tax=Campylobacter jejuni TaxID=197 RepID=UPI0015C09660|nr:glycosyltransferase family 2 protein [Campylobacter jejuni]NWL85770.1 glycosyltransferase family 2 protein [Campylobacter jejuni subsp. jejuni]